MTAILCLVPGTKCTTVVIFMFCECQITGTHGHVGLKNEVQTDILLDSIAILRQFLTLLTTETCSAVKSTVFLPAM